MTNSSNNHHLHSAVLGLTICARIRTMESGTSGACFSGNREAWLLHFNKENKTMKTISAECVIPVCLLYISQAHHASSLLFLSDQMELVLEKDIRNAILGLQSASLALVVQGSH